MLIEQRFTFNLIHESNFDLFHKAFTVKPLLIVRQLFA